MKSVKNTNRRVWRFPALGLIGVPLILSACGVVLFSRGDVGLEFTSKINPDRIISRFHFNAPEGLSEVKTPDDMSVTAKRRRLIHIDPLELPDHDFVLKGSDTIPPVTQYVIDEFHDNGFRGVFNMSQSITGDGMRALCSGEAIDIVNASRAMKPSEKALCVKNGVVPVSIKIGYDPFVFIAHRDNTWLNEINHHQLARLFESQNWQQLNRNFPNQKIQFFLPYKPGGSMAAMTNYVYGNRNAPFIREIENAKFYPQQLELTRDLSDDPYSIGFASYGKLSKLKHLKAKILPINGVPPVASGEQYPLKRSLYILTSAKQLKRPEVQTFIATYLNLAHKAMPQLGFSPLNPDEARRQQDQFVQTLNQLHPDLTSVSVPTK